MNGSVGAKNKKCGRSVCGYELGNGSVRARNKKWGNIGCGNGRCACGRKGNVVTVGVWGINCGH